MTHARISHRRSLIATALCAALGVAAVGATPHEAVAADAASVRRAQAIATEAKFLFKQKAYEEAAARFFEAYTLVNKPALLFNAARAYQEAGNIERAAALFRAYLELEGVGADGKAEARQRLAPLEAALAERRASEKAAADKAAAERAAAERAEAERQAAVEAERRKAADARLEAERQAARSAAERAATERRAAEAAATRAEPSTAPAPGRSSAVGVRGGSVALRPTPWAPIGATAGAAALGAVLYGVARSQAAEARSLAGEIHDSGDKERYLELAANARGLQVGAIVAGALAAAGAGWTAWALLRPTPAAVPTALLLPAVDVNTVGATLSLSF